MIRNGVLVLAALAVLPGSPSKAEKVAFTRPPYAGAYEPQGVDERGLWMDLDEMERTFQDSPSIVHDPLLERLVKTTLCQVVGNDRCLSVRAYVVKDSSFNAGMYPNGLMLVNTGLLARLHSEAELATVLGHEFAHFERRHGLKDLVARRKASDLGHWIALAGAVAAVDTRETQIQIAIASIAFTRAQETEADTLSGAFVRASPLRLRASNVWRRLIEEDDAVREARGLKKLRRLTPALTDDHPTTEQRFLYFARLEAEAGERGEDGIVPYREATERALSVLFDPLIKGNDFTTADYVIRSRGDALGWDGPLLAIRGELYRQRGSPRDLTIAQDLFGQAIARPDAPPESWRGLGLCALRLGNKEEGRRALAEYLKRAPGATDVSMIKLLLEN